MRMTRARGPRYVSAVVFAVALALAAVNGTSGQEKFSHGQNIAPSFEGWEENPDGTFNMVFGYLNRNYDEHLDIPIGPDNSVSPGPPDQGQPTHFLPRRNRYVFRVKVPKDFGKEEVVWTITAHGKTERAYATLKPEYMIEPLVMMLNNNSGVYILAGADKNKAPVVSVEGDTHRTVKVGEPLALTAVASDDGFPKPRPARSTLASGHGGARGLRVAWFVYRGAGTVTFDPEQFHVYVDYKSNSPWTPGWAPPPLPADGKFPVKVTFSEGGTYVLRVQAHDGGLDSTQDVTVTVTPPPAASRR